VLGTHLRSQVEGQDAEDAWQRLFHWRQAAGNRAALARLAAQPQDDPELAGSGAAPGRIPDDVAVPELFG
jgi:hypothetical protein